MAQAKANFLGMYRPRHGFGRRAKSLPLTLLATVFFSMVLAAPAEGATIRDEFDAIAYNGNNGTANWTGDWIEAGESNGPNSGFLRVVNGGGECSGSPPRCMRLGVDGTNNNRWLWREADLTGATFATFTYDFDTRQADVGWLFVEVSGNGGSSWTELTSYNLASGDVSGSESFDITAWIAADTQIRFRGTNINDEPFTTEDFRGYMRYDNIQILSDAAASVCPGGVVTTTVDSTTGGSLRACIIWANGNPGVDTLNVPAGTYTLTIAGTSENAAATGDLDITDGIIINGNAAAATIIDANSIDRVFEVLDVSATFSNVTVRNGNVTGNGGGIAVSAAGTATLTASTLSSNTATDGGGISSAGTTSLTNVTVSGNTATRGGGLDCLGPCTLTNVTVTGNTAPTAGDGVRQRTGAGSITFLNTIVANNGAEDCDGNAARLISNGYNISSDASCDFTNTGDQQNTDPLLGPLQNNGGPTDTHALSAFSPGIDNGTNTGCPATDQRGTARPLGGTCDVGSYETAATCPSGGTVSTTVDSLTGDSLRACIIWANANPGADTITFNIAGAGPHIILPTSALPPITDPVTIDGSTEPDFVSTPIVVLDGSSAGGGHGLEINSSGTGSTIRGLRIIRFGTNGIQVQAGADGVTIAGNWIGTDGTGSTTPGNGNNGINFLAASSTIGGSGALDGNVINNNGNEGISLTGGGATGNFILGNIIGLESDGTTGSGNGDVGIALLSGASGNTIGGLTAASRNIISMNYEGIEINSPNNIVIGNYIGTDVGGTLDRGQRSDDGIEINSGGNDNTIGGTAAGAGNLIAFNQLHGVNVAAGTSNQILGNRIHSNGSLGIDLDNDGVTANDAGDADSGANDLLNFPVITSAIETAGTLDVDFDLDVPAGDYRIEFFTNPLGADPSGNGEGEIFADALTITHGGTGVEPFSHSFAGVDGDILTTTATQEFAGPTFGASSEFGAAITAGIGNCPGGIVRTTTDTGASSLRECINYANGIPGTTITFNILGPGNRSVGADSWWGISPATPLPTVTAAATVIDATTQTTNQGDTNSRGPEVEIDGTSAGAGVNGLVLDVTAAASTIRGLAIGNFSDNGILLLGGSNIIAGNYLGLSADGDTTAANNPGAASSLGGIRVESASNTIGGVTAADRNVISGNGFAGIELFGAGASGNMVFGNFIGVDATGTLARPNSQEGVDLELSGGNFIGGPLAGQRNIISGNASDGVEIDGGDFNVVQGNYIGTDFTGTALIPNGRDGIDLNDNGGDGAQNNLIGGTGVNEGNLIRGNTLYGINVRDATVINNSILGNQIYENVLLDIDLNDDGITINDPLDADSGSNDRLNYPVIIAAPESGGTITVNFDLDVPAGDYRIEFFTNPSGAHGTGNGGGEIFASATTITHGGTGVENFIHAFAGSAGDVITATATEELAGPTYNSTSEFSTAFTETALTPFTAHWPLDETSGVIAADIDAGNDGTYQNGVLLNQLGACTDTGNAVYFDGVDDFVEVPHSADYLIDEGTVSFWANVDALGTEQSLFSKDSTGFDTGGHLTINVQPGGQVRVRLQSSTGDNFVNSAPISAGTWVHVAFTWGPAGMALYIDGAAPITNPYIGGLGVTSGGTGNFEPIAFGASTKVSGNLVVTPTEEHLAGYMDDVRINNRALTLPEIQTLATCNTNLNIIKRAFQTDGTPIPTGSVVPDYLEFKYLLYVNNPGGARTDISVRDVLDPAFQYQLESMQVDNSVAECAAAICDAAEELAIFTAVNGAPVLTDALGDDVVSYAAATIDAGNGNVGNLQLDINADSVWAILFSVKMP